MFIPPSSHKRMPTPAPAQVLGWGTAHGYRWGRQEAHTTARYLQLLPPGHEQLAQLLHAHALAVELERQGVPPVVCASPLEKVQQPSQPPQTAAREPEGVLADGLPAWKLLRACVQGFDIADASEQEYQHYVFCVSCGFIRPVVRCVGSAAWACVTCLPSTSQSLCCIHLSAAT